MQKLFLVLALLLTLGAGCVSLFEDPSAQLGANKNKLDENSICQNTCGNGTCEDIVCQGTGCPCAETVDNCPQDCAETSIENLIVVTSPNVNANIDSPVTVQGQARGVWYFEASFPVKVYDANDVLLGTGVAQAQSDWMTEDFVEFVASVTYTTPTTATGTIVLEKDNPSDLPEHDNSLSIPIVF